MIACMLVLPEVRAERQPVPRCLRRGTVVVGVCREARGRGRARGWHCREAKQRGLCAVASDPYRRF